MRTASTLDNELAKELTEITPQGENPPGNVISETVSNGLQARESSDFYRLEPVSLGGLCADVNLDKALSLADAIDDEEIVRTLMIER